MQLRQAEPVRIVYKNRIRIGNIQTRLDNRRAYQHIRLTHHKLYHRRLKLALAHLAVCDADLCVASQFLNFPRLFLNRFDPVMQEKHLPLTIQFPVDCFSDKFLIVGGNCRNYTSPVQGRRRQRAYIAQPQKRHMQCPRNRRGSHCKNINVDTQFFESFFMFDPEPLLLVDYQKPQILEPDVATEKPMRSYQYINSARLCPCDYVFCLLRRLKSI